jgi:hypothetical protein
MHLVPCATPPEPLEDAPRSALLSDLTDGEHWEGFWSADSYFVRCTRATGDVEWFQLADDVARHDAVGRVAESARVLHFPVRTRLQTRVVLAKSPDGRRMLVGTAGRAGRAHAPRTAE